MPGEGVQGGPQDFPQESARALTYKTVSLVLEGLWSPPNPTMDPMVMGNG